MTPSPTLPWLSTDLWLLPAGLHPLRALFMAFRSCSTALYLLTLVVNLDPTILWGGFNPAQSSVPRSPPQTRGLAKGTRAVKVWTQRAREQMGFFTDRKFPKYN